MTLAWRARHPRARSHGPDDRVDRAGRALPRELARSGKAEVAQPRISAASPNNPTSASRSASPSGSTSRAAPPAVSGSAVTLVATTGVPLAIASSTGNPKPSYTDGSTNAAAPA